MAKIKVLKYEIAGVNYTSNVNVGVDGYFNTSLPSEVSTKLGIQSKLSYAKLNELENDFYAAIKRYCEAETTQLLFILIRYGASGRYNKAAEDSAKSVLFYDKYGISGGFDSMDSLGFEFHVCMAETVDGHTNWYKTRLGKDHAHWDKEQHYDNPEKYYKAEKFYHVEKFKKIPYTDASLATLKNARETIRKMSELLFNFIEQDEKAIEAALTNQKLLE